MWKTVTTMAGLAWALSRDVVSMADRASQVSGVVGLIDVTQGRSGMRWSLIMDGEETQWWGRNMTEAHGD